MQRTTTIFLIAMILGFASCANWAVLVAGSNGFYNYRHQADICHAYQTLIKGGIPASNIIVMAYNDIANNTQNPVPGKLFNKSNGPDVYAGCVIDYQGADVTPAVFLSILAQDANAVKGKGTGRVLKSTSADNVFINFSDHGAPGLIAFPSQYLYATDLTPVLLSMNTKKQYAKCTFYLEACESGSMFVNFPTNQNLYALTAANPNESSWADYCPPADVVNNGQTHIGSCLGDLFSTNWMEDTDANNTSIETLQAQYLKVQQLTTQSHVMQYGDLSFTSNMVSTFVGNENPSSVSKSEKHDSLTNVRDIKLMYLINRHAKLMTPETQSELNDEIKMRKYYDDLFISIKALHPEIPTALNTDFTCYKDMISSFEGACGKFTEYGYKYMRVFYDLCNAESANKASVKSLFTKVCIGANTFSM